MRTRANFRPVKTARPGRPWPRYWRDVPYPVPTVSAPPVARLTPRSWFNCVSPSAHQADLCHKPLSRRQGSSGVRLQVSFCLFRMRGQAIEAMKMRTGPALVPRAAPAFLLIGHAGQLLSKRQRQGRAAPLAHDGTWLALLAPVFVSAFSFFFFLLFPWRARLPDCPVLPNHRARVPPLSRCRVIPVPRPSPT